MGGNVSVMNLKGNEVRADKLDLRKIDRSKFIEDFMDAFHAINDDFQSKETEFNPLWDDVCPRLFSGSAAHLFDVSIPDYNFINVKPVMGDIDIMVDETKKEAVWKFLKTMQAIPLTSKITYIGDNRPNYSEKNKQINSIFSYYYASGKSINVQVDFEFLPFKDGYPTEWSTFSHSSSWEDMEMGIKGVHHKFLLRSLAAGSSVMEDAVIMTPKCTYDNPRVKVLHKKPTMLKFSVDHGLREGYEPQWLWLYEGRQVYKDIPVSDSTYNTNITEIAEVFFNMVVSRDQRINQKMSSFVGLCGLMYDHLKSEEIQATYDYLVQLWWGKYAQALERNNPDKDYQVKYEANNYFLRMFPNVDISYGHVIKKYYDNYRMDEE